MNHQEVRHTRLARKFRSTLVRLLVGPGNWPLVLRPPEPSNPALRATSTHIYVHLPFCNQICPHCPYNKSLYKPELHAAFAPALHREIAAYLSRPDLPRIRSLYFGGGTPSRTPDLVESVLDEFRPLLAEDARIGIEVHPGDASTDLYRRLRRSGINRVSLGIESFSPVARRLLGRNYTAAQAERAITLARAAGFDCVDVNLIFGVPGQTVSDAVADAETCVKLGVDQISTYPLLSFVHTPLGKRIASGRARPYGERDRIRVQKEVSRVCREGGLERTSMWSFARPGMPSYTTVTHEDYVGFGAGAATKVDDVFLLNTFSLQAYSEAAEHKPALVMQAGDALRRFHWLYWQIYRIRIEPHRYHELYGRDLARDFGMLLGLLRIFGFARKDGNVWQITESGTIWLHRLRWFYSLHHVDTIWTQCQRDAWPTEVVLA